MHYSSYIVTTIFPNLALCNRCNVCNCLRHGIETSFGRAWRSLSPCGDAFAKASRTRAIGGLPRECPRSPACFSAVLMRDRPVHLCAQLLLASIITPLALENTVSRRAGEYSAERCPSNLPKSTLLTLIPCKCSPFWAPSLSKSPCSAFAIVFNSISTKKITGRSSVEVQLRLAR